VDDVIRQLLHLAAEGADSERDQDNEDEGGNDDDGMNQSTPRLRGLVRHRWRSRTIWVASPVAVLGSRTGYY
jgi:hypothetical protein